MTNESNKNYQYDRCSSRGICSINPTTSSLQEIILLYLRHAAFYELKLLEKGVSEKNISNFILNTISILSSSYEISENNFYMINYAFQKEFPKVIDYYKSLNTDEELQSEIVEIEKLLNNKFDINEYIRLGEKAFNKRIRLYDKELRSFFRIIFTLVKSIVIHILTFESFGKNIQEEFSLLLEVLNNINNQKIQKDELKKLILDISKKDCELMMKIRLAQEEEYGIQTQNNISYSTTKGKAILVVGSNLKELEQILNECEKENIDIYTHDNMILAHTFPKFKEYKNLKGQYGQGMESCLLDFSTFPGPIILTRNSLFNIENLYKGRLYTTDFAYSKGVIPINNDDFSSVIKSAKESKGFKTGKICDEAVIGFNYHQVLTEIYKRLRENHFKRILIIGIESYTESDTKYFQTLLGHVPDDTLVLSLSCCEEKVNRICLNAIYDTTSVLKLSEELIKNSNKQIAIFYPYCDRHTLSVIIYTSSLLKNNIFIGRWNNSIVNPAIIDILKTNYNVQEITTPKNDLTKLIKE